MKKLTFDELENTLDREDMRNIMAGSGGSLGTCRPDFYHCHITGCATFYLGGQYYTCDLCCRA